MRWLVLGLGLITTLAVGAAPPATTPTDTKPTKPPVTTPPVTALAYRDAKLLAAGTQGIVHWVDPQTADHLGALQPQPGRVTALAWSPTGLLAVAYSQPSEAGRVVIYAPGPDSAGRPQTIQSDIPKAHRDTIYAMAFSPDGRTLATGSYDRQIKLWDVASSRLETPRATLTDHSDAVYALAFQPQGTLLASGAADRSVKIWDVQTGERLYTLGDATDWVYAVAWTPDGSTLAAGGVDKSIRMWSITPKEGKLIASGFAHSGAVTQLAVSPDGTTLLSAGEDGLIKVWDRAKLTETTVIPKQADTITAFSLRPDGHELAVGLFNGHGIFVDRITAKIRAKFLPPKPQPPSVSSISPPAVPRGRTTRVKLTGQRLDRVSTVAVPGGTSSISKQSATELEVDLNLPATHPIGPLSLTAESPDGNAGPVPVLVDRYAAISEQGQTDSIGTAMPVSLPATVAGVLDRAGDMDYFALDLTAGQQLGVQATFPQRAIAPILTVWDAHGTLLTESNTAAVGFIAPRAGRYYVSIHDQDYRGAADMTYRLHLGDIPIVSSVFPLAIPRGQTASVQVNGVHLGAVGEVSVTIPSDAPIGSRVPIPLPNTVEKPLGDLSVAVAEFPSTRVQNGRAELRQIPSSAEGLIQSEHETHQIAFPARRDVPLVVEVEARRLGSALDSHIEIQDADGKLVPRATLRCVAKTFTTFRDHDADKPGIRLEFWNELGMKDYLFANGELMRIHSLPRGPDDDCLFVQIDGKRVGFLGTTPTHHPFGNPMYKVEVHPPHATFPPNGMPVFTIPYRNDDDPQTGKDSFLIFTAPTDGTYQVRIRDSRGGGGPNFAYRLTVREPRPTFHVDVNPKSPAVARGTGRPLTVTVKRVDGYQGPVQVRLDGLPPGWEAPPVTIEDEQTSTTLNLFASENASPASEVQLIATATIAGQRIDRTISLGKPTVTHPGDLVPSVLVDSIVIRPGQETRFRVQVDRRNGFKGRVPLDVRGLPYGVRVLNVGLNGILLTERDSQREIVLYAEPWVQPVEHPVTVLARRESTGQEYTAPSVRLRVESNISPQSTR